MRRTPQRIVCLSAEAADWLWRIGAWENIAGVTAYFEQPEDATPKPRVSGFISANFHEIEKLNPDLIITFSDVQARLTAELMQRGFTVIGTNQRTLAEIEQTLTLLGQVTGHEQESENLLREFRERLAPIKTPATRPRVYFEEWNNPLISGIGWVSELIERAGGDDIFASLRTKHAAVERMVSPEQILQADPEIIFASWCGKPVSVESISSRPSWENISAIRNNQIFEIPSEDILQPGFRLIYGCDLMKRIIFKG